MAVVDVRQEIWEILDTISPYFKLTLKQYVQGFYRVYQRIPEIPDLKRLFPKLNDSELAIAVDIAKTCLHQG